MPYPIDHATLEANRHALSGLEGGSADDAAESPPRILGKPRPRGAFVYLVANPSGGLGYVHETVRSSVQPFARRACLPLPH